MRNTEIITQKIFTPGTLIHKLAQIRLTGATVSFTNGCFDILHRGHIASLSQAAAAAKFLVVGVNSDASTKKLKGEGRPVNDENSRALLLAALVIVDAVVIFDEDTPLELIKGIKPDVLVKGGDYTIEQVVGAKEVIEAGGQVIINPIVEGFSTTGILEKIRKL
jgi:D-beta-D-heptose 7-phosphate kinase/D-beta-D-heptose 1-phosphate adenosyltransferase